MLQTTAEYLLDTLKGTGRPGHPMHVSQKGVTWLTRDIVKHWHELGWVRRESKATRPFRKALSQLTERSVIREGEGTETRRKPLPEALRRWLDGAWDAGVTEAIERVTKTKN